MLSLLLYFCSIGQADVLNFYQDEIHDESKSEANVFFETNLKVYLDTIEVPKEDEIHIGKNQDKITERVYFSSSDDNQYKVFYQTNSHISRSLVHHNILTQEISSVFSDNKFDCKKPYFHVYYMLDKDFKNLQYPNTVFQINEDYYLFLCDDCDIETNRKKISELVEKVIEKECICLYAE